MEEEGQRNMEGSNPNRPCDTCGDAGNASLLETCFICKVSNEHIYCMGFGRKMPERPEKWSCAACSKSEIMTSVQLPRKTSQNLQTKLGSRLMSAARSSRSSRDYIKEVQTGKVKYLDVADAVKLSSGEAAAMARMGSQTGSSRNLNHITSRKYPASVSEASKRFSTSPLPSQHTSPPGYFNFSVPTRGQPCTKQPQVIKTSLHSHAGKPKIRESDAESETLKRFSTSPLPSQHTSPPGYFTFSVPTRGQPSIKQPQVIKTSLHSHAGKPKMRDSDAETKRSPSNWSRPIKSVAKDKHKVSELLRKNKPGTEFFKPPVKKYVLREEESFHASPPPAKQLGSSKHVNSPFQEFVLREEESLRVSPPPVKQVGSSQHVKSPVQELDLPEEESFHVSPPPAKQVGSSKHVKSPVQEFDLPEQESVHVSSPPAKQVGSSKDGSSSEEYDMFEKGLPDHLSISSTWKGSFEIVGTTLMDGSYEGLQAHPPRKVHVKAAKVLNEMPRQLQFKLHPRSDVSLENFNRLCPTKDDIALYFLPGDDERSTKNYHILSDFIVSRDLTMRSCLNDVELLIFTSKKLPADCQKIKSKFYLCGVFRSAKKHRPSAEPSEKSLPNNCDSDVDRLKRRPFPKPSERHQHKEKDSSPCNNYDSVADRVKHHPSTKPSERHQHKEKDYSPCNNYDSDADRVKHHPSTKFSERRQQKEDKDYSPCNNYDSIADRVKLHPSTKPSERHQQKDKDYSPCNNYDSDADRVMHHPSTKPSEKNRFKDINYDTDVDILSIVRRDSLGADMDIDMAGGKDVGKTDKVVLKSNCVEKRVQFNIKSTKKVCPNVINASKRFDDSEKQPISTIKKEQPQCDAPPGFTRPTTADAAILERPGLSRPITADAAILRPPPGFSRPATADAVILEPPPGFSRSATADAAILKPPPGFSRPTTADAAILEPPPGFSRPTTPDAAISEPPPAFSRQAIQAALLEPPPGFTKPANDLSSLKRKRISLDASTSEYFQVSPVQRQKHIQVSDSLEFPSQNHQVTDHCHQMQSASIDHKPDAEKEKSSECKRDGIPSSINGFLIKDPKIEDDCSDSLKLTLWFDDEVGGWQAH
ncbi:hypothetical protein MKW98_005422 [Papaver atlanticum]|uniref:AIPP2-like SPOC-like domain-containing protein n=1 Tax=Papaver atlanticum TaxID=357466 RepID=A0AAD4RXJ2_9MAGN|nr:hypothetical protein MKW98_005422 [Papaver atlanticum]